MGQITIQEFKLKQRSIRQEHLSHVDNVNLGSYYIPTEFVQIVLNMISPYIDKNTTVINTSCGYGSFTKSTKCNKVN